MPCIACGRPGRGTRCKACTPTTVERGYGAAHRAERRANEQLMAEQGYLDCWRCGERIEPGEPWDQGHDEARRNRGPEHANRCNRAAAGRKTHDL